MKKAKKVNKEEVVVEDKTESEKKWDFYTFYQEIYLKDAVELIGKCEPHHADKHGVLGYEKNVLKNEIQTKKEGISHNYVDTKVYGLCEKCTTDRESAKEAYEKSQMA